MVAERGRKPTLVCPLFALMTPSARATMFSPWLRPNRRLFILEYLAAVFTNQITEPIPGSFKMVAVTPWIVLMSPHYLSRRPMPKQCGRALTVVCSKPLMVVIIGRTSQVVLVILTFEIFLASLMEP